MRNISASAIVLFVCGPGAGNLWTVSIAVSLSSLLRIWKRPLVGYLKAANLLGANEGLVVAAQDQALRTRYYEHHILDRDVSPTCRVCSAGLKAVDHIVAGCSAMAPTNYTDRHNQVASIIHWHICRHFQVPVESRWYRHQPDRLVETNDIAVMWDMIIPTAGKIKANRPDICLRDKKANTCLLIYISCPADGNAGRKHAEKLAKYGDLLVEISRMRKCRTRVVSELCMGTVHAGIARWLDIIPGPHNLQKQCCWNPLGSFVKSCLPPFIKPWYGLSTPEAGFASGTCDIPYDLVEHNNIIIIQCDDIELWDLSVFLSYVSLALFMRLRFVSVVGEFLWSGERHVDHDV